MVVFIGREKELAMLNQAYSKGGNSIVVLYGREQIGKTTLVKKFVQDKTYVYYQARELSEKEQNRYFEKALFSVKEKAEKERIVFVVDEFDLMQKGYKTFFADFLMKFDEFPKGQVMVFFVSSAIGWVENDMVSDMGELAKHMSLPIKLKEFTFVEMVDRFPESTTKDCILIYGILGGVPGYLEHWNPKESVKQNIVRLIVDKKGVLHTEAQRFLKTSLRELPFYSTILSVLAENEPKLNYLFTRTGFSRAKISVYIKNLIQIDVAEKIFSYEPEKRDSVQKGLYGITDSFLQFWYQLIYPNFSDFSIQSPDEFYEAHIKNGLDELAGKAYQKVCREFMELMNQYHHLPAQFERFGSLYGKSGFIPLIANTKEGKLLVGTCKWSNEPMTTNEFEELLQDIEQTGKEADYYYLFSKEGFTNELSVMAKSMDNIQCIDLEAM